MSLWLLNEYYDVQLSQYSWLDKSVNLIYTVILFFFSFSRRRWYKFTKVSRFMIRTFLKHAFSEPSKIFHGDNFTCVYRVNFGCTFWPTPLTVQTVGTILIGEEERARGDLPKITGKYFRFVHFRYYNCTIYMYNFKESKYSRLTHSFCSSSDRSLNYYYIKREEKSPFLVNCCSVWKRANYRALIAKHNRPTVEPRWGCEESSLFALRPLSREHFTYVMPLSFYFLYLGVSKNLGTYYEILHVIMCVCF